MHADQPVRLLLVDDDEDALFLTRELLSDLDSFAFTYELEWARSFQEALQMARSREYDAYVLDYRLGARTGFELLEELREVALDRPAILLTGQGGSFIDLEAMRNGFSAYLPKDQLSGPLLERTVRYAIERKRAERLEKERASFADAARAMEEVLGVLGHELRTPLAGLRSMAEFLLTDGAQDTPTWHQFLQSIHDEVLRMSDLVNNLLEAARLDSGCARWNWSAVNVERICEEAIEIVRPLIGGKPLDFAQEFTPDNLWFSGDPDAIRRLIINLVTNATKHTLNGHIRLNLSLIERDESQWVRIAVQDTGDGIPQHVLEQLGDAFALNAGVVQSSTGGIGLGLSICRGIVAAHGGSIFVTTEQGKGSTFVAMLRADLEGPVLEAPPAPILQEAAP